MTAGYLTGKYAFDTFSHLRGTLDNPKWVDTFLLSGRYPPYTVSYPFLPAFLSPAKRIIHDIYSPNPSYPAREDARAAQGVLHLRAPGVGQIQEVLGLMAHVRAVWFPLGVADQNAEPLSDVLLTSTPIVQQPSPV